MLISLCPLSIHLFALISLPIFFCLFPLLGFIVCCLAGSFVWKKSRREREKRNSRDFFCRLWSKSRAGVVGRWRRSRRFKLIGGGCDFWWTQRRECLRNKIINSRKSSWQDQFWRVCFKSCAKVEINSQLTEDCLAYPLTQTSKLLNYQVNIHATTTSSHVHNIINPD